MNRLRLKQIFLPRSAWVVALFAIVLLNCSSKKDQTELSSSAPPPPVAAAQPSPPGPPPGEPAPTQTAPPPAQTAPPTASVPKRAVPPPAPPPPASEVVVSPPPPSPKPVGQQPKAPPPDRAKSNPTDSFPASAKTGSKEAATAIPSFPWPPPAASATDVVPADLLSRGRRLQRLEDVNTILRSALDANGYVEKRYYAVPHGFALVTRLEQIATDGKSMSIPERWSSAGSQLAGAFSIRDYIRALFSANEGHYRLIVFIVNDVPFAQSLQSISSAEAQTWLRAGLNVLPPQIGQNPYTPAVVCTALIYEFEKKAADDPTVVLPSTLDSRTHLTKSGLWRLLVMP